MTNKRTKQKQPYGGVNQLVNKLVKQKLGEYSSNSKYSRGIARVGNTPFADVGAHLGGFLGYGNIGRGVGSVIGRILGSGDYLTNFDSVKNTLTSPVPAFGNESTTITHREYIGDVISAAVAGDFKLTRYRINPADAVTMPWLASMAQNFEEYTLSGMIFEFKTTSGASVASTNTSLGTVILATQYDPTKPTFVNKQEMENHFFAQSTVPSNSVLHAIECKKGEAPLQRLYISDVTDPTYDPRFSDYGNFSIATVGQPGASVNLGELWVSYKLSLHKPKLNLYAGGVGYSGKSSRSTCTPAAPFGLISFYQKGRLVPIVSSTSISFFADPGDYYLVSILWSGVGAACTMPALTITGAILAPVGQFINNSTSAEYPGFGPVEDRVAYVVILQCTNLAAGKIILDAAGAGVFPGAPNFCDIVITSMDKTSII